MVKFEKGGLAINYANYGLVRYRVNTLIIVSAESHTFINRISII